MSASSPSASAALPDDAPEPRTPWQRWALAVVVGMPVAALYAGLVTLVGRAFFLGRDEGAYLREKITEVSPSVLLWLVAAVCSASGAVLVVREVLDARAGRDGGDHPWRTDRSWLWPVILGAAPVVAIVLAAAAAGLAGLTALEPGVVPVIFAALAGMWPVLFMLVGWVLTVRVGPDDGAPAPLEGVEHRWFEQASSRAFWDVVPLAGVGSLIPVLTGGRVDGSLILAGVVFFAMADWALRVWLARRREERA